MARERIELNGHDTYPLFEEGSVPGFARARATVPALGRLRSGSIASAESRDPERDDIATRAIDIDGEEEAQFLRTQKRIPVRRGPLPRKAAGRIRAAFVIAGVAILIAGLTYATGNYALHSGRFRIDSSDNIEVSGVHNALRAQVMDVARDDIGRNVFFVTLDDRRRKLEQIPWVESATVMRRLPNRIVVSITERTPVAFVRIGPKIQLIDAQGAVMGLPANRQTRYSFPVIHGIAESDPVSSRAAVMKIYNRLIRELESDDAEGAHFTRQLSEVDLSDPEDVKATVNDAGGTVVIHLGSSDFLERYKLFAAHIGEWRHQFKNVESVDLRYEGQIVVNPDQKRDEKTGVAADVPPPQPKPAVKPAVKKVAAPAAKKVRHRRRRANSN
jgi:cell division protein FtsQ